jgi:hypothetical protein
MSLKRVVFPHPEGPRRKKSEPLGIETVTLSTAAVLPKKRETFWREIVVIDLVALEKGGRRVPIVTI